MAEDLDMKLRRHGLERAGWLGHDREGEKTGVDGMAAWRPRLRSLVVNVERVEILSCAIAWV